MTRIARETRETRVEVELDIAPANASARIDIDEPALCHMLETLARYAGWSLSVTATGDLRHHLIEDVALTLGEALLDALPERCARYGSVSLPMDDALVQVALDAGGRPYYEGELPSTLYEHFFRSLAHAAAMTLHIVVIRGRDRHHIIEATFKAVGLSLRQALRPADAIFSTKGGVHISRNLD
jgi:imidazoleglycerol-phosphate dehydratase